MSFELMYTINLAGAILPVIIGVLRLPYFDRAVKVFFMLAMAAFLTEAVGVVLVYSIKSNIEAYSAYSIIEIVLLALFYNYAIPWMERRHLGIYLGVTGATIGTVFLVSAYPDVIKLNSWFMMLEGILVVSCSLVVFGLYLNTGTKLRFSEAPHFWLSAALLFFWGLSFAHWGLYEILGEILGGKVYLADQFLFYINLLTNLFIAFIFYKHPKRKLSYV